MRQLPPEPLDYAFVKRRSPVRRVVFWVAFLLLAMGAYVGVALWCMITEGPG